MNKEIEKPEGVDTEEEKLEYIGKRVKLIAEDEERIIEKSFWSTPCGYWTQCFKLKDGEYIMRSRISKFL